MERVVVEVVKAYISISELWPRQVKADSNRSLSKPTMTSLHSDMTGTLRAPPDIFFISSSAALSVVTSYAVKSIPFLERNSFADLQYGHVGVV